MYRGLEKVQIATWDANSGLQVTGIVLGNNSPTLITKSYRIDYGNGFSEARPISSAISTNQANIIYTYPNAGNFPITISANQLKSLTDIRFTDNSRIIGTLDLRFAKRLNSLLISRPITQIVLPSVIDSNSQNITAFIIENTNLTSLNLSQFTKLGGNVRFNQNSNLTSITFPNVLEPNVNNLTALRADLCNLNGVLDISMFTKIGGDIRFNTNPNLTEIIIPDAIDSGTQNIVIFNLSSITNLQGIRKKSNPLVNGVLDLTIFDKLGGSISLNSNPNITAINFPTTINPLSNNVTALGITNCNLTGTLDLSMFAGKLGGNINLDSNPNLTSINLPVITNQITQFSIQNTSVRTDQINDILDLSNQSLLSGSIRIGRISPLSLTLTEPKVIIFPDTITATNNIANFTISRLSQLETVKNASNPLTTLGEMDLRMFTKLGGVINLASNSQITNILFPNTLETGVNNVTSLGVNNCNLTGTLDLSMFTKFTGGFSCSSNPNLTNVIFPTLIVTEPITNLNMGSCNLGVINFTPLNNTVRSGIVISLQSNMMTAAEVNENLVNLDATGWVNCTLNIAGNNAAPDTTSGGFNGTAAIANLILKGWTVVSN
jgi:hypothetical protein